MKCRIMLLASALAFLAGTNQVSGAAMTPNPAALARRALAGEDLVTSLVARRDTADSGIAFSDDSDSEDEVGSFDSGSDSSSDDSSDVSDSDSDSDSDTDDAQELAKRSPSAPKPAPQPEPAPEMMAQSRTLPANAAPAEKATPCERQQERNEKAADRILEKAEEKAKKINAEAKKHRQEALDRKQEAADLAAKRLEEKWQDKLAELQKKHAAQLEEFNDALAKAKAANDKKWDEKMKAEVQKQDDRVKYMRLKAKCGVHSAEEEAKALRKEPCTLDQLDQTH